MKFSLTLLAASNALELTSANYEEMTSGKSVFIKFLAPWWGHCKSMKPAWDKLMTEYKGEGLIADVDCTKEQAICSGAGVQGYPTIMYGSTSDFQKYNGGRDFDSLLKHANENLGPTCGPANLDLCDEEQKADIDAAMAKSLGDLDAEIKAGDDAMAKAGTDFEAAVKKLQAEYEGLQKAKDAKIAEIKDSGLGVLKSVRAHKQKGDKKEL